MPIEKILRLPFDDNFSVDVQIRIKKSDNGYKAYVQGGVGSENPFDINITPNDVVDLNSQLQEVLQKVHSYFDPDDPSIGEPDQALALLAQKGAYAFNKIFPRGQSRELISKALKHSRGRVVQITSNDFLIPWEIVYDLPITSRVNILGFWGMRHIIARSLAQSNRLGDFVTPLIKSQRPRVGMVTCHELSQVVSYEIPAFEEMDNDGIIDLSVLPILNTSQRNKELSAFKSFLRRDREIVHFACHAFEKNPLDQSFLRVEETFDIRVEDFITLNFQVGNFPLVILNACRTGMMDPTRTSNWVSQFWARGARGVLATEFRVPDWFAARFAKQLYKHLLAKKPKTLGHSLMLARYDFWNEGKNPLGLAYALYSSPNIQFIR
jgi:CHAT domain-containing protein